MKTPTLTYRIQLILILSMFLFGPTLIFAQLVVPKDMFPLSIGNQWTYQHRSSYGDQLLSIARFDTGVAHFAVIGSIVLPDSTRWIFRQIRSLKRQFSISQNPDTLIHDTLDFEIVERNRGFHPMYRQGKFNTLWDSEFPFFAEVPESTMIHRYFSADSSDTLDHSFKDIDGGTFVCSLKNGTGEIAEQLSYHLTGSTYSTNHILLSAVITSLGESRAPTVPPTLALAQNYPNPFNPETIVSYELPAPSGAEGSVVSDVKLVVCDILGRQVAVLVNGRKAPGSYSVVFNASGLASGVYIYRLISGGISTTKRMLFLK